MLFFILVHIIDKLGGLLLLHLVTRLNRVWVTSESMFSANTTSLTTCTKLACSEYLYLHGFQEQNLLAQQLLTPSFS